MRENEADSIGKARSAEIDDGGADIENFDKLKLVTVEEALCNFCRAGIAWMVVEFANDCVACVREINAAGVCYGDRVKAHFEPLIVVGFYREHVGANGYWSGDLPGVVIGPGHLIEDIIDLNGEDIDPSVSSEIDSAVCYREVIASIGCDNEWDLGREPVLDMSCPAGNVSR